MVERLAALALGLSPREELGAATADQGDREWHPDRLRPLEPAGVPEAKRDCLGDSLNPAPLRPEPPWLPTDAARRDAVRDGQRTLLTRLDSNGVLHVERPEMRAELAERRDPTFTGTNGESARDERGTPSTVTPRRLVFAIDMRT
jgi:hypothetical protein